MIAVKKVKYDLPWIGGLVSLVNYVAWLPHQWTKVKLIDLRFEGRCVPVLLCERRETRRGIGCEGMHRFGEQK